jgi:hypothetical protein
MLVRQATNHDLGEILRLYKEGLEELGYTDWKEHLLVKKITESFVTAPCFLLVIDDRICGMAGLTLVTISHSGVASLQDYMFFVEKEHRSPKTLKILVDACKQFANKNSFPLRFHFLVFDDLALKARVLQKHGLNVFSVSGEYNG